jgi:dihydroxyacetone kinase
MVGNIVGHFNRKVFPKWQRFHFFVAEGTVSNKPNFATTRTAEKVPTRQNATISPDSREAGPADHHEFGIHFD